MRIQARFPVLAALLVTMALLIGGSAEAGSYSDDLGKCFIQATTERDRDVLVRWMFATTSLHPSVQSLSNVSAQQRANINKEMGKLYERLLLQSCKQQAIQAIKHEGPDSTMGAFQALGEFANQAIYGNPNVLAGLSDMLKYVDMNKFGALVR